MYGNSVRASHANFKRRRRKFLVTFRPDRPCCIKFRLPSLLCSCFRKNKTSNSSNERTHFNKECTDLNDTDISPLLREITARFFEKEFSKYLEKSDGNKTDAETFQNIEQCLSTATFLSTSFFHLSRPVHYETYPVSVNYCNQPNKARRSERGCQYIKPSHQRDVFESKSRVEISTQTEYQTLTASVINKITQYVDMMTNPKTLCNKETNTSNVSKKSTTVLFANQSKMFESTDDTSGLRMADDIFSQKAKQKKSVRMKSEASKRNCCTSTSDTCIYAEIQSKFQEWLEFMQNSKKKKSILKSDSSYSVSENGKECPTSSSVVLESSVQETPPTSPQPTISNHPTFVAEVQTQTSPVFDQNPRKIAKKLSPLYRLKVKASPKPKKTEKKQSERCSNVRERKEALSKVAEFLTSDNPVFTEDVQKSLNKLAGYREEHQRYPTFIGMEVKKKHHSSPPDLTVKKKRVPKIIIGKKKTTTEEVGSPKNTDSLLLAKTDLQHMPPLGDIRKVDAEIDQITSKMQEYLNILLLNVDSKTSSAELADGDALKGNEKSWTFGTEPEPADLELKPLDEKSMKGMCKISAPVTIVPLLHQFQMKELPKGCKPIEAHTREMTYDKPQIDEKKEFRFSNIFKRKTHNDLHMTAPPITGLLPETSPVMDDDWIEKVLSETKLVKQTQDKDIMAGKPFTAFDFTVDQGSMVGTSSYNSADFTHRTTMAGHSLYEVNDKSTNTKGEYISSAGIQASSNMRNKKLAAINKKAMFHIGIQTLAYVPSDSSIDHQVEPEKVLYPRDRKVIEQLEEHRRRKVKTYFHKAKSAMIGLLNKGKYEHSYTNTEAIDEEEEQDVSSEENMSLASRERMRVKFSNIVVEGDASDSKTKVINLPESNSDIDISEGRKLTFRETTVLSVFSSIYKNKYDRFFSEERHKKLENNLYGLNFLGGGDNFQRFTLPSVKFDYKPVESISIATYPVMTNKDWSNNDFGRSSDHVVFPRRGRKKRGVTCSKVRKHKRPPDNRCTPGRSCRDDGADQRRKKLTKRVKKQPAEAISSSAESIPSKAEIFRKKLEQIRKMSPCCQNVPAELFQSPEIFKSKKDDPSKFEIDESFIRKKLIQLRKRKQQQQAPEEPSRGQKKSREYEKPPSEEEKSSHEKERAATKEPLKKSPEIPSERKKKKEEPTAGVPLKKKKVEEDDLILTDDEAKLEPQDSLTHLQHRIKQRLEKMMQLVDEFSGAESKTAITDISDEELKNVTELGQFSKKVSQIELRDPKRLAGTILKAMKEGVHDLSTVAYPTDSVSIITDKAAPEALPTKKADQQLIEPPELSEEEKQVIAQKQQEEEEQKRQEEERRKKEAKKLAAKLERERQYQIEREERERKEAEELVARMREKHRQDKLQREAEEREKKRMRIQILKEESHFAELPKHISLEALLGLPPDLQLQLLHLTKQQHEERQRFAATQEDRRFLRSKARKPDEPLQKPVFKFKPIEEGPGGLPRGVPENLELKESQEELPEEKFKRAREEEKMRKEKEKHKQDEKKGEGGEHKKEEKKRLKEEEKARKQEEKRRKDEEKRKARENKPKKRWLSPCCRSKTGTIGLLADEDICVCEKIESRDNSQLKMLDEVEDAKKSEDTVKLQEKADQEPEGILPDISPRSSRIPPDERVSSRIQPLEPEEMEDKRRSGRRPPSLTRAKYKWKGSKKAAQKKIPCKPCLEAWEKIEAEVGGKDTAIEPEVAPSKSETQKSSLMRLGPKKRKRAPPPPPPVYQERPEPMEGSAEESEAVRSKSITTESIEQPSVTFRQEPVEETTTEEPPDTKEKAKKKKAKAPKPKDLPDDEDIRKPAEEILPTKEKKTREPKKMAIPVFSEDWEETPSKDDTEEQSALREEVKPVFEGVPSEFSANEIYKKPAKKAKKKKSKKVEKEEPTPYDELEYTLEPEDQFGELPPEIIQELVDEIAVLEEDSAEYPPEFKLTVKPIMRAPKRTWWTRFFEDFLKELLPMVSKKPSPLKTDSQVESAKKPQKNFCQKLIEMIKKKKTTYAQKSAQVSSESLLRGLQVSSSKGEQIKKEPTPEEVINEVEPGGAVEPSFDETLVKDESPQPEPATKEPSESDLQAEMRPPWWERLWTKVVNWLLKVKEKLVEMVKKKAKKEERADRTAPIDLESITDSKSIVSEMDDTKSQKSFKSTGTEETVEYEEQEIEEEPDQKIPTEPRGYEQKWYLFWKPKYEMQDETDNPLDWIEGEKKYPYSRKRFEPVFMPGQIVGKTKVIVKPLSRMTKALPRIEEKAKAPDEILLRPSAMFELSVQKEHPDEVNLRRAYGSTPSSRKILHLQFHQDRLFEFPRPMQSSHDGSLILLHRAGSPFPSTDVSVTDRNQTSSGTSSDDYLFRPPPPEILDMPKDATELGLIHPKSIYLRAGLRQHYSDKELLNLLTTYTWKKLRRPSVPEVEPCLEDVEDMEEDDLDITSSIFDDRFAAAEKFEPLMGPDEKEQEEETEEWALDRLKFLRSILRGDDDKDPSKKTLDKRLEDLDIHRYEIMLGGEESVEGVGEEEDEGQGPEPEAEPEAEEEEERLSLAGDDEELILLRERLVRIIDAGAEFQVCTKPEDVKNAFEHACAGVGRPVVEVSDELQGYMRDLGICEPPDPTISEKPSREDSLLAELSTIEASIGIKERTPVEEEALAAVAAEYEGPPTETTEAPTELPVEAPTEATEAPTEAIGVPTEPPSEAPTEPPSEAPTEPASEAPTEPTSEAPTEPTESGDQTQPALPEERHVILDLKTLDTTALESGQAKMIIRRSDPAEDGDIDNLHVTLRGENFIITIPEKYLREQPMVSCATTCSLTDLPPKKLPTVVQSKSSFVESESETTLSSRKDVSESPTGRSLGTSGSAKQSVKGKVKSTPEVKSSTSEAGKERKTICKLIKSDIEKGKLCGHIKLLRKTDTAVDIKAQRKPSGILKLKRSSVDTRASPPVPLFHDECGATCPNRVQWENTVKAWEKEKDRKPPGDSLKSLDEKPEEESHARKSSKSLKGDESLPSGKSLKSDRSDSKKDLPKERRAKSSSKYICMSPSCSVVQKKTVDDKPVVSEAKLPDGEESVPAASKITLEASDQPGASTETLVSGSILGISASAEFVPQTLQSVTDSPQPRTTTETEPPTVTTLSTTEPLELPQESVEEPIPEDQLIQKIEGSKLIIKIKDRTKTKPEIPPILEDSASFKHQRLPSPYSSGETSSPSQSPTTPTSSSTPRETDALDRLDGINRRGDRTSGLRSSRIPRSPCREPKIRRKEELPRPTTPCRRESSSERAGLEKKLDNFLERRTETRLERRERRLEHQTRKAERPERCPSSRTNRKKSRRPPSTTSEKSSLEEIPETASSKEDADGECSDTCKWKIREMKAKAMEATRDAPPSTSSADKGIQRTTPESSSNITESTPEEIKDRTEEGDHSGGLLEGKTKPRKKSKGDVSLQQRSPYPKRSQPQRYPGEGRRPSSEFPKPILSKHKAEAPAPPRQQSPPTQQQPPVICGGKPFLDFLRPRHDDQTKPKLKDTDFAKKILDLVHPDRPRGRFPVSPQHIPDKKKGRDARDIRDKYLPLLGLAKGMNVPWRSKEKEDKKPEETPDERSIICQCDLSKSATKVGKSERVGSPSSSPSSPLSIGGDTSEDVQKVKSPRREHKKRSASERPEKGNRNAHRNIQPEASEVHPNWAMSSSPTSTVDTERMERQMLAQEIAMDLGQRSESHRRKKLQQQREDPVVATYFPHTLNPFEGSQQRIHRTILPSRRIYSVHYCSEERSIISTAFDQDSWSRSLSVGNTEFASGFIVNNQSYNYLSGGIPNVAEKTGAEAREGKRELKDFELGEDQKMPSPLEELGLFPPDQVAIEQAPGEKRAKGRSQALTRKKRSGDATRLSFFAEKQQLECYATMTTADGPQGTRGPAISKLNDGNDKENASSDSYDNLRDLYVIKSDTIVRRTSGSRVDINVPLNSSRSTNIICPPITPPPKACNIPRMLRECNDIFQKVKRFHQPMVDPVMKSNVLCPSKKRKVLYHAQHVHLDEGPKDMKVHAKDGKVHAIDGKVHAKDGKVHAKDMKVHAKDKAKAKFKGDSSESETESGTESSTRTIESSGPSSLNCDGECQTEGLCYCKVTSDKNKSKHSRMVTFQGKDKRDFANTYQARIKPYTCCIHAREEGRGYCKKVTFDQKKSNVTDLDPNWTPELMQLPNVNLSVCTDSSVTSIEKIKKLVNKKRKKRGQKSELLDLKLVPCKKIEAESKDDPNSKLSGDGSKEKKTRKLSPCRTKKLNRQKSQGSQSTEETTSKDTSHSHSTKIPFFQRLFKKKPKGEATKKPKEEKKIPKPAKKQESYRQKWLARKAKLGDEKSPVSDDDFPLCKCVKPQVWGQTPETQQRPQPAVKKQRPEAKKAGVCSSSCIGKKHPPVPPPPAQLPPVEPTRCACNIRAQQSKGKRTPGIRRRAPLPAQAESGLLSPKTSQPSILKKAGETQELGSEESRKAERKKSISLEKAPSPDRSDAFPRENINKVKMDPSVQDRKISLEDGLMTSNAEGQEPKDDKKKKKPVTKGSSADSGKKLEKKPSPQEIKGKSRLAKKDSGDTRKRKGKKWSCCKSSRGDTRKSIEPSGDGELVRGRSLTSKEQIKSEGQIRDRNEEGSKDIDDIDNLDKLRSSTNVQSSKVYGKRVTVNPPESKEQVSPKSRERSTRESPRYGTKEGGCYCDIRKDVRDAHSSPWSVRTPKSSVTMKHPADASTSKPSVGKRKSCCSVGGKKSPDKKAELKTRPSSETELSPKSAPKSRVVSRYPPEKCDSKCKGKKAKRRSTPSPASPTSVSLRSAGCFCDSEDERMKRVPATPHPSYQQRKKSCCIVQPRRARPRGGSSAVSSEEFVMRHDYDVRRIEIPTNVVDIYKKENAIVPKKEEIFDTLISMLFKEKKKKKCENTRRRLVKNYLSQVSSSELEEIVLELVSKLPNGLEDLLAKNASEHSMQISKALSSLLLGKKRSSHHDNQIKYNVSKSYLKKFKNRQLQLDQNLLCSRYFKKRQIAISCSEDCSCIAPPSTTEGSDVSEDDVNPFKFRKPFNLHHQRKADYTIDIDKVEVFCRNASSDPSWCSTSVSGNERCKIESERGSVDFQLSSEDTKEIMEIIKLLSKLSPKELCTFFSKQCMK